MKRSCHGYIVDAVHTAVGIADAVVIVAVGIAVVMVAVGIGCACYAVGSADAVHTAVVVGGVGGCGGCGSQMLLFIMTAGIVITFAFVLVVLTASLC